MVTRGYFTNFTRVPRVATAGLALLVALGLTSTATLRSAYAEPSAAPPTLTVIKEVINDDFGSATADDFPLYVFDGSNYTYVTNGEATTLTAGVTYAVGEENGLGYTASFSGDCDANGEITLADGDNKTCTITNDDDPPGLLVSSNSNGMANSLAYRDEDILGLNLDSETWVLVFDGSDVGLEKNDIDAFSFLYDGTLLLSLESDTKLAEVGAVDDADVLLFEPTSLGEETAGSFTIFLDGSDVGLNSSDEDIDALDVVYLECETLPVGTMAECPAEPAISANIPTHVSPADLIGVWAPFDLLISVRGKFNAQNVKGNDEDIFYFYSHSYGPDSAGEWYMNFDGSDLDLTKSSEDITSLSSFGPFYFMTTEGKYAATGVENTTISGDGNDIFLCVGYFLGNNTACGLYNILDVGSLGLGNKAIDGMQVNAFYGPLLAQQVSSGAVLASATGQAEEMAIPTEDDSDEVEAEDDSEAEKAAENTQRLFFPLLRK